MSGAVGQPPLGHDGGLSAKNMALGVAGCALVAGGVLAWCFWPSSAKQTVSVEQQNWGLPTRGAISITPPQVAPPPHPAEAPPKPQAAPPPAVAKPHFSLGFFEHSHPAAAASPAGSVAGTTMGDDGTVMPGGPQSEFTQRMQSQTSFDETVPVPRKQHPLYTIAANYEFDCLPNRPIASNLPGPIKCMVVNEPVWSEDPYARTNPLLPIGTQIDGMMERGLTTGEDRLFVVWKLATTPYPQHFKIPLDGLGASPMGQIGLPGDIDDHLWPKLKATLMVSGIQMLTSLPSALLQQGRNNTSINLGGIGNTGQSLSQMAFQHDMNIPTTLYRGPGQPIKVITTHAIDLYKYYQQGGLR